MVTDRQLKGRIERAMQPSDWDLSNRVLYDLVAQNPQHTAVDAIAAKILLIGRVYAAAIERQAENAGDDFYLGTVVPKVLASDIDQHLTDISGITLHDPGAVEFIVDTHGYVTNLFNEISLKKKRSLASKYLHFHRPELFYIYDSKAVAALGEFRRITGRASRTSGHGDNEYRKFVEKCHRLREYCEKLVGSEITPRQLDNLLLKTNER